MLEYGHHERTDNEFLVLGFSTQACNFIPQPVALFDPLDTQYQRLCCHASSARLTARSVAKLQAYGVDESAVDMTQVLGAINNGTGLSEQARSCDACCVRPITDRINPAWRSDGSGRGVFNGGSGSEHGVALQPGFVLGVFTGECLTMSEYKERARLDPFKHTYCCDMPSTQYVYCDSSNEASKNTSINADSNSSGRTQKDTLCVDAANRGNELSRINDFRTNALRPHIPQHPSRPYANCDFLEAQLYFDDSNADDKDSSPSATSSDVSDGDAPAAVVGTDPQGEDNSKDNGDGSGGANSGVVVVPIMVVVKAVPFNAELLADYGEAYWSSYRDVMNRCWSEMGGY